MTDVVHAPETTITTTTVGDDAVKMEETTTVEVNGSSEVNGVGGGTPKDNTEVKASKVAKIDVKTVELSVVGTAVKIEGKATIVVNSTSEVNGVCEDTPENNTEVKTSKVEKLEVNDIKQDIEQPNGNLVEKQPVVAVETNTEAAAETDAEVFIKKTEEPPQKDASVENGLVKDSSTTEKNVSVEKTMENGEVPLSEAASESPAEEKSEPIDENKAEATTESEIETITSTETDKKD